MLRKALFLILIFCLLFAGCTDSTVDTPAPTSIPAINPKPRPTVNMDPVEVVPPDEVISMPSEIEGQLIASADSQQSAEEIAELYQIQLLAYSNGIALYHTDEDADEVIARGLSNGWPPLSKNSVSYAAS